MFVGLLHEGSFDDKPLRAIISRVFVPLTPYSAEEIKYKSHEAGGQILTHMKIAEKIFFQDDFPVNIAVYVSDVDKYPERKKQIPEWIKNYSRKSTNIIVAGLPEPNFEHWLMQEGNALKNILGIPGNSAIYGLGDPKPQIKALYDKHNKNPSLTIKDLYVEAASTIDLEYLAANDASFRFFIKSLKTGISQVYPSGPQTNLV